MLLQILFNKNNRYNLLDYLLQYWFKCCEKAFNIDPTLYRK